MERDAPQSTPPATLCKAGCGFYGSPNFDSMCSKCFKEALKKKNQNPSQNDGTTEANVVPSTRSGSDLAAAASGLLAVAVSEDKSVPMLLEESQKRKAEDDIADPGLGATLESSSSKKRISAADSPKASPSGTPSPSTASSTLLATGNATTAPLQSPTPLQSSASATNGATATAIVSLPTSLETGTPTIPTVTAPVGPSIVICSSASSSLSSSCSSTGANAATVQQPSPLFGPAVSASHSGVEGGGSGGRQTGDTPGTPSKLTSLSDDAGTEASCDSATPADGVSGDESDKEGKKTKKNRCQECRKKVGLTGFECRCGGLYCSLHRYSDKHSCSFDYQAHGAEQIRKANPVVVSEKVQKI